MRGANIGPLNVFRVVLVGDRISPAEVHGKPDGTVVRTLWGELAWQLGGRDGYEMVRDADEKAISPGGSLLFLLQRFSPCLILIDEWAPYARRLYRNPSLPAGNFDAHVAFAHALAHAVRCTKKALLVTVISASQEEPSAEGERAAVEQLRKALDPPVTAAPRVDETQLLDDLFRATASYRSSQGLPRPPRLCLSLPAVLGV